VENSVHQTVKFVNQVNALDVKEVYIHSGMLASRVAHFTRLQTTLLYLA
jgi:hypothetical protein